MTPMGEDGDGKISKDFYKSPTSKIWMKWTALMPGVKSQHIKWSKKVDKTTEV